MMLEGRTALVTGAARGIGKAVALALAGHGADVVISDVDPVAAEDCAGDIERAGRRALAVEADSGDWEAVSAGVKYCLDNFERIDILVNNAGITRDALLLRMKPSDWSDVININLTGAFNWTRAAARPMMRRKSGSIVNIASIIGIIGNAGQANYAASKAGLIGLTKSSARELAPRGIRVNAVAPGFIDTRMTEQLPAEVRQKMLESIPLARWGRPEEVASAALFLASDMASYITGQVVVVDGGMVMQ